MNYVISKEMTIKTSRGEFLLVDLKMGEDFYELLKYSKITASNGEEYSLVAKLEEMEPFNYQQVVDKGKNTLKPHIKGTFYRDYTKVGWDNSLTSAEESFYTLLNKYGVILYEVPEVKTSLREEIRFEGTYRSKAHMAESKTFRNPILFKKN